MLPQSTSPASSSHNPPNSDHKRKRERHVLSCLDCRRRKVKCDREYPVCGRCEKGGNAATCTYKSRWSADGGIEVGEVELEAKEDGKTEKRMRLTVNGPILSANERLQDSPVSMVSMLESTIKRLEKRLADLERIVARETSSRATEVAGGKAMEVLVSRKGKETYFFKGRGFRTQFYGTSSPASLLAHVCMTFRPVGVHE
jgi:hypothetical protein